MALTRKLLKGMGLGDEQIDTIIDNHSDTVNGLKDQVQEYKDEVERLKGIEKTLEKTQAELDAVKKDGYKEKYESLEKEFSEYKETRLKEDEHRSKSNAYRALIKEAGISGESRIDSVLKLEDVDSVELDKDGNIKDADKITESIKTKWGDLIPTTEVKGASTANPPANNGGNVMSKEEIMKIKDPVKRQNAIAENIDLFQKKGE